MPTTATPPRRPYSLHLGVDLFSRPRRVRPAYALKYLQDAQPVPFAQPIGPCGVIGDRLSHHMTLRFPETLGRASYPDSGRLVKRERHFYHTAAILP